MLNDTRELQCCSDAKHFAVTLKHGYTFHNKPVFVLKYPGMISYSLYSFRRFVQRFLVKSGRSLWKHETIQSCEVVLHNRPATFKRSYTHKLSYYNSVVSCWTITCMQGAGPGSETTGKVTGCKQ